MHKTQIKNEIEKRSIRQVVHFTQLSNLENILKYGLLPKDTLDADEHLYEGNDDLRIDSCINASCLSVSFPNYKMFYSCRMQDRSVKWIVISFDPRILWKKDCAFCVENAASNAVACMPLESRKTPESFLGLFKDHDNYPTRADLSIPEYYPTNPQAEILIFEPVERIYIKAIYFQTRNAGLDAKNKYGHFGKIRFASSIKAFGPRIDYPHWK